MAFFVGAARGVSFVPGQRDSQFAAMKIHDFHRDTKLMSYRLTGAVPVEGGIPLLADGKIEGAIGASGGTSDQDGITALAGAAAIK